MNKLKNILHLMRIKHYLKNMLVLLPLFFDLRICDLEMLKTVSGGFIIFSLLSSVIYIVNDLRDLESDKKSLNKRKRPLAAGSVSIREAYCLLGVLSVVVIWGGYCLNWKGSIYLILYFVLNLIYSFWLKHVPIADVAILASGFVIRLLFGGVICDIKLSFWLNMTVMLFSLYMGLGKRRGELLTHHTNAKEVRSVLQYYSAPFLDKNMYMCLGLGIAFYALWSGADETIEKLGSDLQIWTVPLVIIITMKYSLNIEIGDSGDPMEVLFRDKWLIFLGMVYVGIMFWIMYIG